MATSIASPAATLALPNPIKHRWDIALTKLSKTDAAELQSIPQGSSYLDILTKTQNLATGHMDLCKERRWKFRKSNGEEILVQDQIEGLFRHVKAFESVVNTISSFDPRHFALPWAAVQFVLTLTVSDGQILGTLVEGLEFITILLARCAHLEWWLNAASTATTTQELKQALLALYISILRFQAHTIHYCRKGTVGRMLSSLTFSTKDIENDIQAITSARQEVDSCLNLITAEYTQDGIIKIDQIKAMLEKAHMKIEGVSISVQDLARRQEDFINALEELQRLSQPIDHITTVVDEGHGTMKVGSGKSSLVSTVIDDLKHRHWNTPRKPLIAYFYCKRDAGDKQRSDPEFIMRSILEQISLDSGQATQSHTQEPIVEKYNQYVKDNGGHDPPEAYLSYDETVELLLGIFDQNPAYMAIDGLDECEPRTRGKLISTLHHIIQKSSSVFKVFVSSRPETDIIHRLGSNLQICVQTKNSNDINDYIKTKVAEAVDLNHRISPETQQLIVETLSQKATGMFLWVALQVNQLCDPKLLEADIHRLLRKLPKTIDQIYDVIYQNILDAETASQSVALQTLQVLLHAQETLPRSQMMAAVTISLTFNKVLASSKDEIIDACSNLVVFDSGLDSFWFFHLSVREYLENNGGKFTTKIANKFLMERCLYVFLCKSRSVVAPDESAQNIREQNDKFSEYATKYWPVHCKLGEVEVTQGSFLAYFVGSSDDSSPFGAWWELERSRLLLIGNQNLPTHEDGLTPERRLRIRKSYQFNCNLLSVAAPRSILPVACVHQLESIFKTMVAHADYNSCQVCETVEPRSMGEQCTFSGGPYEKEGKFSLLEIAAYSGSNAILKMLLNKQGLIYAKGNIGEVYGARSLIMAAIKGNLVTAELLVNFGVHINAYVHVRDGTYTSCLSEAILQKDKNMVDFLIKHGFKVNSYRDEHLWSTSRCNMLSPLYWAVVYATGEILQTLINEGGDVRYEEEFRTKHCIGTLLSYAVHPDSWADITVIPALLAAGSNKNSVGKDEIPLLHYALPITWTKEKKQLEIIRLLLENGASPDAQDRYDGTIPHFAVLRGFHEIVIYLLRKGADPTIAGFRGGPLLATAERCYMEIPSRESNSYDKARKSRYGEIIKALKEALKEKEAERRTNAVKDAGSVTSSTAVAGVGEKSREDSNVKAVDEIDRDEE